MAAPRLFVSSTFYDLRFVRADLSVLKEQMGLEVIRFETGAIPYHTAETLPEACCKEIDTCNIMVSVIGGRYGSTVTTREQIPTTAIDESCDKHDGEREVSISRLEVERAIRSGLVLFTFVDAEVLSEHRFFDQNRDESDHIHWSTVDSIRVFEFIDFIKGLPGRNPVFEFRTPIEIQDILRDQLSGLLREFLERERMAEYRSHIDHIIHSAEKLQSLQQELRQREEAMRMQMREMQLPDHPFYSSLRRSAGAAFRIYFKHYEEMLEVLAVVGYVPVDPEEIQKGKADRMIYFYSERQDVGRRFMGVSRTLFPDMDEIVLPPAPDYSEDSVWHGDSVA